MMSNLRPATINDLALLQLWDEQAHIIASDPCKGCLYLLPALFVVNMPPAWF